jgi:glycosyltransferase involved in cell wall biosynthesis
MPCYNASATLDEAIVSILRQSLVDFELVAVDDGSTDDTGARLIQWAQADARIRPVSQPHKGIVHALNFGMEFCHSPYIARMDADDRSLEHRLELQANYLDENPHVDLVSCQVRGFPEGQVREGFRIYLDWLNSLLTHADIRREIFVESPLPHPSVMYRKQRVIAVGAYQDVVWAEDYDLWLRLYLAGAHFAKLPQVLMEWREHPQRLTRIDSRYSLENFLRAKAHYLVLGPLQERDAVFIWGAGMMGRRLGKQLLKLNAPVKAFVDIDARKIGRTRLGKKVISPVDLPDCWRNQRHPVILACVGARGARQLIRQRLVEMGFEEGRDWWGTA